MITEVLVLVCSCVCSWHFQRKKGKVLHISPPVIYCYLSEIVTSNNNLLLLLIFNSTELLLLSFFVMHLLPHGGKG